MHKVNWQEGFSIVSMYRRQRRRRCASLSSDGSNSRRSGTSSCHQTANDTTEVKTRHFTVSNPNLGDDYYPSINCSPDVLSSPLIDRIREPTWHQRFLQRVYRLPRTLHNYEPAHYSPTSCRIAPFILSLFDGLCFAFWCILAFAIILQCTIMIIVFIHNINPFRSNLIHFIKPSISLDNLKIPPSVKLPITELSHQWKTLHTYSILSSTQPTQMNSHNLTISSNNDLARQSGSRVIMRHTGPLSCAIITFIKRMDGWINVWVTDRINDKQTMTTFNGTLNNSNNGYTVLSPLMHISKITKSHTPIISLPSFLKNQTISPPDFPINNLTYSFFFTRMSINFNLTRLRCVSMGDNYYNVTQQKPSSVPLYLYIGDTVLYQLLRNAMNLLITTWCQESHNFDVSTHQSQTNDPKLHSMKLTSDKYYNGTSSFLLTHSYDLHNLFDFNKITWRLVYALFNWIYTVWLTYTPFFNLFSRFASFSSSVNINDALTYTNSSNPLKLSSSSSSTPRVIHSIDSFNASFPFIQQRFGNTRVPFFNDSSFYKTIPQWSRISHSLTSYRSLNKDIKFIATTSHSGTTAIAYIDQVDEQIHWYLQLMIAPEDCIVSNGSFFNKNKQSSSGHFKTYLYRFRGSSYVSALTLSESHIIYSRVGDRMMFRISESFSRLCHTSFLHPLSVPTHSTMHIPYLPLQSVDTPLRRPNVLWTITSDIISLGYLSSKMTFHSQLIQDSPIQTTSHFLLLLTSSLIGWTIDQSTWVIDLHIIFLNYQHDDRPPPTCPSPSVTHQWYPFLNQSIVSISKDVLTNPANRTSLVSFTIPAWHHHTDEHINWWDASIQSTEDDAIAALLTDRFPKIFSSVISSNYLETDDRLYIRTILFDQYKTSRIIDIVCNQHMISDCHSSVLLPGLNEKDDTNQFIDNWDISSLYQFPSGMMMAITKTNQLGFYNYPLIPLNMSLTYNHSETRRFIVTPLVVSSEIIHDRIIMALPLPSVSLKNRLYHDVLNSNYYSFLPTLTDAMIQEILGGPNVQYVSILFKSGQMIIVQIPLNDSMILSNKHARFFKWLLQEWNTSSIESQLVIIQSSLCFMILLLDRLLVRTMMLRHSVQLTTE